MSYGVRFVGKDPDGIAKAISVNDDGVLLVELLGSLLVGEVAENPTANTILGRMKSLESKIDTLEDKIDKITNGTTPAVTQLSGSIMGKDPTGNAKAINVNANGDLQSVIVGGKTEIAVFNKSSLPTTEYYTPGFFEPRDTSNKVFCLPHAGIGVFEQAIGIRSTLDVPVTLSIKCVVNAGDGDKNGATIWTGTVPTDARFYFVSDRSDSVVETSFQKIIGLIELRLPFVYFIIDIKASSPPTTGQIMVQSVRRY